MTDRTPTRGLRDRLAKAIRKGAATSDIRPSYRVADAVLPVVEEETAALRARAEQAEAALQRVRDLADRWDHTIDAGPQASALRDALTGAQAAERAQRAYASGPKEES